MARKKLSQVWSSDQYALVKKFPDGWYYRLGSSSSYPWLGPFLTQHVAERVREGATGGAWSMPRKADVQVTSSKEKAGKRAHATVKGEQLISSQDTRAAEKLVRSAASVRFGRGKASPVYEHGQWFVSVWDEDEGQDRIYSVVDAYPGVGRTGLDFEDLG